MATILGVGGGIVTFTGAGSPEGVVTGPVGSTYRRTDGSGITAFYVKQSGAAAVGWVPIGQPVESGEYLILPEGRTVAQSTRVAQLTFDGASQILRRKVSASRLIFRLTAVTLPTTIRVLLFQEAQGGSGIALRIASATVVLAAAGAQTVTAVFTEGTVAFEEGLIYSLFGRSVATGTSTMRTYATAAYDLLNANVEITTHPTTFTTAILSSSLPASINPLPVGGGGDTTASGVDLCPVLRLRA